MNDKNSYDISKAYIHKLKRKKEEAFFNLFDLDPRICTLRVLNSIDKCFYIGEVEKIEAMNKRKYFEKLRRRR